MINSIFTIGADGIDTNKIVEDIQNIVAQKKEKGLYTDAQVARAEQTNLSNLKDDEEFFEFYIDCLKEAISIDISDFNILERRRFFSGFFVTIKRIIWKLMKFYTYRLWSQQNRSNGLLLGAIEGIDNRYRNKIKILEQRITNLESKK